jgi:hypothetical protein
MVMMGLGPEPPKQFGIYGDMGSLRSDPKMMKRFKANGDEESRGLVEQMGNQLVGQAQMLCSIRDSKMLSSRKWDEKEQGKPHS